MYLSSLLIDVGNNPDRPRPGRLWLRNRYRVHQRLCMAFPSTSRKAGDADFLAPFRPDDFGDGQVHVRRAPDSGFLFRIDPLSHGRVVLVVQSAMEPDWDYAFHNAKHLLAAPIDVKPFEPRYSSGRHHRFRLEANPTKRLSAQSPNVREADIGKRVPVPTDLCIDWLARKAESAGFLIECEATILQPGYIHMSKDGDGQRLRSILFDGILQVTNTDALRQAVACGLGSGKAFGFGLLSIAPADNQNPAVMK